MQSTTEKIWHDLIARGEIIRPSSSESLLDEPPGDYGIDLTAELLRMRDEEER